LPSEGSPGLVSPQAAAALQEHYNKVTQALDNARNNNRMNPNLNPGPNLPGNAMPNSNSTLLNPTPAFTNPPNMVPSPAQQAQQAQVNEARLRAAMNNFQDINFSEFTQEIVTKLPTARFEQKLRQFINERTISRTQPASAPPPRGPSRPTSAMVPASNGGPMAHASQGQEGQLQQISPEQAQEVLRLQQELIKEWRDAFKQASEYFLLCLHDEDF
jgi:hypothetical protein